MRERYVYHWLHIPTQTRGSRSEVFESREHFLDFLNRCNRALPGRWQYWEE